jgi:hypothetical protein
MKNAISKWVITHLYNAATALNTGGTAYPNQVGFPGMFRGVTRERTSEITGLASPDGLNTPPYEDYINLFDCPYMKDDTQSRPGIYIGHPGIQFNEAPDF